LGRRLATSFAVLSQVADTAEESLQVEERLKEQLCQELNLLVQQSAHAQLDKLEMLTQRLEALNQVRLERLFVVWEQSVSCSCGGFFNPLRGRGIFLAVKHELVAHNVFGVLFGCEPCRALRVVKAIPGILKTWLRAMLGGAPANGMGWWAAGEMAKHARRE
jgi:hypothetical protein